jgi:hypothetical protein
MDITMITCVLATHPSYKFSRVETKMDHGCTCHFDAMRVDLFLLLIIVPRLAKQREIHHQPPCNLGDQLCKILAHKTEIMKILHRKLYSKLLENGSNDAV